MDLPTYQTGFEYISGLSFADMAVTLNFFHFADLPHLWGFESGWVVLNWLVSAFGFGFHGLLVVCAAINMAVCGWFISRYSKNSLAELCPDFSPEHIFIYVWHP